MIIINRTIDFACCLLAVTAMIITLISCKTTMEQVKPSNAEHTIAEESSMGDDKDALDEAKVLNQQGVKIRISIILVETKKEAHDLLKKLKSGADFAELARLHSIAPGNEKGGDLGYLSPEGMMEQLKSVAVNLKVGEHSGTIKTDSGYFILKKVDEKSSSEVMAIETKEKLCKELNFKIESLRQQGRYQEAIPIAKKVLAIREKDFVPNNPDTAQSLNYLALLYYAQGDYAKAEPLYKRSLAIWEKALGPDHPNVATSLNNLAELYRAQGDYAKAEPLYMRSLAIREKALGPDHPDVATSLNNLAGLYHAQGDYAKAEPALHIENRKPRN